MKNLKIIISAFIFIFCITGCADNKASEITGNSISLEKKGEVNEVIRESFTEAYYSIDELSDMINTELEAFNASNGEDAIVAKRVALSENQTTTDVSLVYNNYESFNSYNGGKLFFGKCQDVMNADASLDVVLSSIQDASKTLAGNDIINQKQNIVITDYDGTVCLGGKVLYISDNCNVSKDQTLVSRKPESDGYIYVIYK